MKRIKLGKILLALLLPALVCAAPARAADPFAGGRFQLLERDASRTDAEAVSSTAPETSGLDTIATELPFSYSEDAWNSAREAVEGGRFSSQAPAPLRVVAISTEAPLAPEPQVEFRESGTALSVTGRKVITLNYSGKKFLNPQTTVTRPQSLSLFEITQQMQVRMQGKVGEKITVNVDYDDTKQDKQDISVIYQGDANEVVQNVSFGDIDLSLPATEFVSYNKQLFGIRADLKTNRLKMTFVGSRTKGLTKTRQYTGNTQFQTTDLLDINYLRRKYYDVTFGNTDRLPIKSGSEFIYIDQQTQAPVDDVIVTSRTANDLGVQASTYTGRFTLLNPGVDYVMDYSKGLLTFNRMLNPQDVVIINYQNSNGIYLSQNTSTASTDPDIPLPGREKIIKTQNDIQLPGWGGGEAALQRELKTYYSIGQTNIVRDDGRGNFTLKIQDLNRMEILPTVTNNMPKYPDNQVNGNSIEVDFEQGIFKLQHPFTLDGAAQDSPDPQIYSAAPVSKRVLRVEYSYRFKTFLLEPDIVLQSDVVRVNGAKLGRNEEYFIDYESGFITFYYPERISQDAKIDITYEVSPFGGVGNQSLVGGRVSYDLGSHFTLGSTLLYQGGIKSNTVPNVTDLTNSMLVYEGDAQLKSLNLLGLRTTLGAEVAQSRTNPNLNNYALVDNMEGVKQDDTTSLDKNFWFITSNPKLGPSDPDAFGPLGWQSEIIKSRDINPDATTDGTQQVLRFNYDFSVSSEVSIVYPLSPTGVDFSQKTMLELVVAGAAGPKINIHLGQVNEDADGTGGMDFLACTSGLKLYGAPKSEDTNCDEQVSSAEDIGWPYVYRLGLPGEKTHRFGAGNGRLDSEDLNRNGRLDPQDFTGGDFGYDSVNPAFSLFTYNINNITASTNTINFTDGKYHTLSMPLAITSADTYKWNAIKQVRISLRRGDGPLTGTVSFARISAVGNTWSVQPTTMTSDTGSLQAVAENNLDNDYTPIYAASGDAPVVFSELYGSVAEQQQKSNSRNLSEQTLAIDYIGVTSTSTAYVYRKFTRPIDISQHAQFRFLVRPAALDPNTSFYLQLGDANNNFKVEIPMDFSTWKLITINQEDLNGDNVPDIWVNGSNYNVIVSSRGSPSLQQVSQIIVGVTAADLSPHSGKVYVNEIHLAKPLTRVGNARKIEGAFEIPGWMSFGGKHRYMDRNFQTPVTAIANQDSEQQSAYLNLTRISFLPIGVTAARQITTTPNAFVTGGNNLVNSLQQGRVKKFDGSASGSLNIRVLPKLGFNYVKGVTDYTALSRKDDKDTYAANLSYALPWAFFPLPQTINANYSLGRSKVNYHLPPEDGVGLYNTAERTDIYGGKLTMSPWKGASLNPSYSLQLAREERATLSAPDTFERYPKSMQQTVDVNSNLLVARWLNPTINYSVTTMENNNLNVTTVTVARSSGVFDAGMIKSVTRTAQGGVSLTLSMNDLMPSNRLLRSFTLSSNYQIQDGDSWANIGKDYDTRSKLWIRDSLQPPNAQGLVQRNSVTLRDTVSSNQRWQPLEGYGLKGRLAPLSTLSLTNNFSNSVQRSEVTGTITRSVNRTFPDMIVSLSQLETLTRTTRWAQNATINLKYSKNTNESQAVSLENSDTYGMDLRFKLLNKVDTAASYNLRLSGKRDLRLDQVTQDTRHDDLTIQGALDYRKFRFTPKADYVSDRTKGALGVVTQDTRTITPSLLIKADLQLPKGLKVPFTRKTIMFTNRIVWTTTLSYAIKTSPITIAENTSLFSLNSSADYEAAKNLRLTFNLGLQRLWHKFLKQEEYVSYQAGSTLTFQF